MKYETIERTAEEPCNICGRAPNSPFRVYNAAGKVLNGCVGDVHIGRIQQISESNRWHLRKEARAIRKALADGQKGKGYRATKQTSDAE